MTRAQIMEAYEAKLAERKQEIEKLDNELLKEKQKLKELRIALGFDYLADFDEVLEQIQNLVKMSRGQQNESSRIEGRRQGIESQLERENDKLWYLIRSIAGDETLEKEITVSESSDYDVDRMARTTRVRTPFNSR